jgi:hypothetical protein
MKQRGCTPSSRVEVGSHEHLVVKTEDGVVERSVLEAKLGAGAVQERSKLVQAALDASDEGDGFLLLIIATLDMFRVRVRHDDSHLAASSALVTKDLDQLRVLVRQKVERVPEQVDLLLGAADEIPPPSRVNVRAVAKRRDQFGRCRAGVRMWTACFRPEKLFALVELFSETPAVTWMRYPAGHPAMDRLGVHLSTAGHFLDRQACM